MILSLCDKTGRMLAPWSEAGYECVSVDLQPGDSGVQRTHEQADVRTWIPPMREVRIVFAFPPCTHLAVSGARWFQAKGLPSVIEALQVVDACRRIAERSGAPWMIENPVSTLATYWRKPDYTFDPCDFAGYLDDPSEDAYTKKTCLWAGGGLHHACAAAS